MPIGLSGKSCFANQRNGPSSRIAPRRARRRAIRLKCAGKYRARLPTSPRRRRILTNAHGRACESQRDSMVASRRHARRAPRIHCELVSKLVSRSKITAPGPSGAQADSVDFENSGPPPTTRPINSRIAALVYLESTESHPHLRTAGHAVDMSSRQFRETASRSDWPMSTSPAEFKRGDARTPHTHRFLGDIHTIRHLIERPRVNAK